MNDEYLLYLQEIKDTEWVIELLSEQFDDAINMMTRNSVIYGGAIRDCLAGKDLIGDLDIAVSASECTSMINKFVKNPKWVNVSNKHDGVQYKKFGSITSLFAEPQQKSWDSRTPQIMTFKTLGNKTVQIIVLPSTCDDPFETVTTMVKQVDIICCGVILTSDNKVFEVVQNAYNDCKKHVLHLNNACYVKDIDNLKQRIEKLSERGWINEININKAIRAVNRRSKQNLEHKKAIARISKHPYINPEKHTHNIYRNNSVKSMNKCAITKNGYIILRAPYTAKEGATGTEVRFGYGEGTGVLTHTGYRFMLSSSDIGHIGGLSDALNVLEAIAKKYRVDITTQPVKNGLVIVVKNKYLGDQIYDRILGKNKHFSGSIHMAPPLVSTKPEDVAPMHTTLPNKKKYKLNTDGGIRTTFGQIDAQTFGQIDAQVSEDTELRTPIRSDKMNKQMLDDLNTKKELSESKNSTVEKHFHYSTESTEGANKCYHGLSRNEVLRLGGMFIVFSRLERIARKYKMDIGIIVNGSTANIITKDLYTSKHVYVSLMGINKVTPSLSRNKSKPLKASSGGNIRGTIRWR